MILAKNKVGDVYVLCKWNTSYYKTFQENQTECILQNIL
jgi:hypothetical protein